MQDIKAKVLALMSKKLIAILATVLTVVLNKKLGLGIDDTSIMSMAGVIITYVISQATIDHAKEKSKG